MSQESVDKKLWSDKVSTFRSLEGSLQSLIKCTAELQKKMELEGVDSYYSVNHECVYYSQLVWRHCARLAEIRSLQERLSDDEQNRYVGKSGGVANATMPENDTED
jgi:hypothetical protein